MQYCSTSELEVTQVKARWDISLIKTREQSRTGQGWSNCTSIIPLRALQLLPWARLDLPCKDTSPDMKMMMRSTLARAWGQIPECLRCDYTPRSGPTYTPMTNIQLQLQKKSFKDLFLKQNTWIECAIACIGIEFDTVEGKCLVQWRSVNLKI